MRPSRPRKPTAAEQRRDQQRQARVQAPTLRDLLPAATQVRVELAFEGGEHLADGLCAITVFPSAPAHFVYDCAFGDCDGTYNLNEEIFGMLRAGALQASGRLYCAGHRARRDGNGPRCELQATYTVNVCYQTERPAVASRPPLTP